MTPRQVAKGKSGSVESVVIFNYCRLAATTALYGRQLTVFDPTVYPNRWQATEAVGWLD
jgi:hypothetical protein